MRADIEEYQSDEHQCQIDHFVLQVLLVEYRRTKKERNHHAAAPNHRHDGYHGTRHSEGVEIDEIGRTQEQADENNRPMPVERVGLPTAGPPQQQDHEAHHGALINGVPTLNHHEVEPHPTLADGSHQVLVVEGTHGSQQGREHHEETMASNTPIH